MDLYCNTNKYSTTKPAVKLRSQLPKHAKTYSCPLAPSQSTCYYAPQNNTPQLPTAVRENLPQRTEDSNVQWPICSTLNWATLAPTIAWVLGLSHKTSYTGNHNQSVSIVALVAHLFRWKSVSIVAARNIIFGRISLRFQSRVASKTLIWNYTLCCALLNVIFILCRCC
jgi:hypothetical protein